jgi:hypothetical protein
MKKPKTLRKYYTHAIVQGAYFGKESYNSMWRDIETMTEEEYQKARKILGRDIARLRRRQEELDIIFWSSHAMSKAALDVISEIEHQTQQD